MSIKKEENTSSKIATAEKAAFSILNFRIAKCELNIPIAEKEQELEVGFTTSGEYSEAEGLYKLILDCIIHKPKMVDTPVIKISLIASFQFDKGLKRDKFPEYFYRNSIAIVYPYLRAFVSTLTAHSNNELIILPLMNLSSLEKPLKENTIDI